MQRGRVSDDLYPLERLDVVAFGFYLSYCRYQIGAMMPERSQKRITGSVGPKERRRLSASGNYYFGCGNMIAAVVSYGKTVAAFKKRDSIKAGKYRNT